VQQEILIGDSMVNSLIEYGVASDVFSIYELGRTLHVKEGELVLLECPKRKFIVEASVIYVKEIKGRNAQVLVFQIEE
jgi:hypothetical protein